MNKDWKKAFEAVRDRNNVLAFNALNEAFEGIPRNRAEKVIEHNRYAARAAVAHVAATGGDLAKVFNAYVACAFNS